MAANTRRSFYAPAAELTDKLLRDLLSLVSEDLPVSAGAWSEMERVVVADWVLREHLSASDNPIQRRDRPAGLLGPKA